MSASTGPTLDATQFSSAPHAGTLADPWPGSAIQEALNALPSTGGTVLVPDGVWLFNSPLSVSATNFNLVGQSLNAQLVFQGSGQLWFDGSINPIMNSTISNLTINDNQSNYAAIRLSNFQNSSFTGNTVLGSMQGGNAAVFFEGGANNQILNNTFNNNVGTGGDVFQIQTLNATPNSGFTVSQNNFDSSEMVVIGLSNVTVSNNHFTNTELGNSIGILVCGPFSGSASNITIDGNTIDATTGSLNAAFISGIGQDPGGTSNINGFNITNNILKSTDSSIRVQALDPSGLNSTSSGTKTNVTITGNQLSSLWGGSQVDISGGTYGSVDNVLVESNTLQNSAGQQNVITLDAHTTDATIQFAPGVELDLAGVAYSSTGTVTLTSGNVLQIVESGATYDLQLDPSQNYSEDAFTLSSDGNGGTDVNVSVPSGAETTEAPQLTVPSSLSVHPGTPIPMGITATPIDSDDTVSITIKGVPRYETITAGPGEVVTHIATKRGSTYTITSTTPGASITDLTLTSTYQGTTSVMRTFTVTASNKTSGETTTSLSQTVIMTDPPILTTNQTNGAPPSSPPGLDHVVALFNQFIAAGFSDQHQPGVLNTNPLSQVAENQEQFLARPHHS
jgi:hypothetical protein